MTQHLVFVGTNVAFNSIGFHAAMIVNRLRNEKQIADDQATNDGGRAEHNEKEQHARAEFVRLNDRLIVLNKKLGAEVPRVEPVMSGGSMIDLAKRKNV